MLVLLYIYTNSTNIPPIMIINRIYEHQNLLSLQLASALVGLRTYQHLLYKYGPRWKLFMWLGRQKIILNYEECLEADWLQVAYGRV